MSAPLPAIRCAWDGDSFVPEKRFADICDRRFVIGEVYPLVVEEDRSGVSHRHEFAWLREAFNQLPEALAADFPTVDHMRKRALIEAGWYDEQIIDAGSTAAALRVRQFIRSSDDFAHTVVRGGLVVIRTAKSQSVRAMKKADFQASKTAILEVVSSWIGITPAELERNAERAA